MVSLFCDIENEIICCKREGDVVVVDFDFKDKVWRNALRVVGKHTD